MENLTRYSPTLTLSIIVLCLIVLLIVLGRSSIIPALPAPSLAPSKTIRLNLKSMPLPVKEKAISKSNPSPAEKEVAKKTHRSLEKTKPIQKIAEPVSTISVNKKAEEKQDEAILKPELENNKKTKKKIEKADQPEKESLLAAAEAPEEKVKEPEKKEKKAPSSDKKPPTAHAERHKVEKQPEQAHDVKASMPSRLSVGGTGKQQEISDISLLTTLIKRCISEINLLDYYPRSAIRRNIKGTVLLSLNFNIKAEMQKINLKQTSGYAILDRAAYRMIEDYKERLAVAIGDHDLRFSKDIRISLPIKFALN